MRALLHWLDKRFPLLSTWNNYFAAYYVPKNLNFWYLFGAIATALLANQFLSGLWLAMFYTPNTELAFSSIQYIMRDVNDGWFLRYLHTTGASALFVVLYLHMFRGLLYGSYKAPRELVWFLGVLLFILMLAQAFFGYLLPWGQMSYWGAQVITSFLGAIPYVGDSLVVWLRGDYAISNPTLQRFYALHVIGLALIIAILVWLHVIALHKVGSNNPEGIEIRDALDSKGKPLDGIAFYPYYLLKDLLAVLACSLVFLAVVFFAPEGWGLLIEQSNYLPADPMLTPEHIKPLWYMAPFYSILRAIPDKLMGLMGLVLSLFFLFLLPWLDKSPVRSMRYKGRYSRLFLLLFVISFLSLGVLAFCDLTYRTLLITRIAVGIYFAYFVCMPWYTSYESTKVLPRRIRQ